MKKYGSTSVIKKETIKRQWRLIDATDMAVGRVATIAARYLNGKHRSDFTPHVDCGDFVVIINTDAVKITGNKGLAKTFYRHSGYPGGLKSQKLQDKMLQDSREVVKLAVRGMIAKNKLAVSRLARLKLYKGSEHRHQAQLMVPIEGDTRNG